VRGLSVALEQRTHNRLARHLLRADEQEDLCFALYRPSTGAKRDTALVGDAILPLPGEREVHGNASFSSEYLLRASAIAAENGAGLALAHSHPLGTGWQGMSSDDIETEHRHAAQVLALTDLPLLGLTLAGDQAWSARQWRRTAPRTYERLDAHNIRCLGERLAINYNPHLAPPPRTDERMIRTVSAWGPQVQADVARQHIGIIGAGSVGIPVGEALARTGVGHITIIDFDTVKLHNLDRLGHATRLDVLRRRTKASVLCDALLRYGTNPNLKVDIHEISVLEEPGYLAALDCDVLFSCVDRPWPRQLLDHIAYAHLIPVIDGGIAVRAKPRLTSADWRAHIATPGRPCMECIGQYLAADVALERAGDLDDPTYIETLPENHPHRARENVYAFSTACASLEILQWLSMSVAPQDIADVGSWNFHFVTGNLDISTTSCKATCLQTATLAQGDYASPGPPIAAHPAARDEITAREQHRRRPTLQALERVVTIGRRAERLLTSLATRGQAGMEAHPELAVPTSGFDKL